MSKRSYNILSRRSFLDGSIKAGLGAALGTLLDVPPVLQRAMAEGTIGTSGKKVLFIFLRGANDALNSVIPVEDPAYYNMGTVAAPVETRPDIGIVKEDGVDYSKAGQAFDATQFRDALTGTSRSSDDATYSYDKAIGLGNGFAALHPSLKFLSPVYNAGELCLVHRVAYPKQSRSHFDSQAFWENGAPYSSSVRDGIFYRAMIESGLANTAPFTGVSVQRSLPLILRGSQAAMTNINSTDRYALLGLPGNSGRSKSADFLKELNSQPFSPKRDRDFLRLQYENLNRTLDVFDSIRPDFSDAGNVFRDDAVTDGDLDWYNANGSQGYYLFPTTAAINGGWAPARRDQGCSQVRGAQ